MHQGLVFNILYLPESFDAESPTWRQDMEELIRLTEGDIKEHVFCVVVFNPYEKKSALYCFCETDDDAYKARFEMVKRLVGPVFHSHVFQLSPETTTIKAIVE